MDKNTIDKTIYELSVDHLKNLKLLEDSISDTSVRTFIGRHIGSVYVKLVGFKKDYDKSPSKHVLNAITDLVDELDNFRIALEEYISGDQEKIIAMFELELDKMLYQRSTYGYNLIAEFYETTGKFPTFKEFGEAWETNNTLINARFKSCHGSSIRPARFLKYKDMSV